MKKMSLSLFVLFGILNQAAHADIDRSKHIVLKMKDAGGLIYSFQSQKLGVKDKDGMLTYSISSLRCTKAIGYPTSHSHCSGRDNITGSSFEINGASSKGRSQSDVANNNLDANTIHDILYQIKETRVKKSGVDLKGELFVNTLLCTAKANRLKSPACTLVIK